MRRPLVRDIKDIIKKTLGCKRPVFLEDRNVVVLLAPKISEVIKIKKALAETGNEMDCFPRKIGFNLLYDNGESYYKFYIVKREYLDVS